MFIVNQNLQMRSARGLLFEFIAKLRQQLKIVLKLLNPESVFSKFQKFCQRARVRVWKAGLSL